MALADSANTTPQVLEIVDQMYMYSSFAILSLALSKCGFLMHSCPLGMRRTGEGSVQKKIIGE